MNKKGEEICSGCRYFMHLDDASKNRCFPCFMDDDGKPSNYEPWPLSKAQVARREAIKNMQGDFFGFIL